MDLAHLNSSGPNVTDSAGSSRNFTALGIFFEVLWPIQDLTNIIGNIIIIILIYKDNKMKPTVSKLFVNQSIADGLVGCLLLGAGMFDVFSGATGSLHNVVYTCIRIGVFALCSESLQTLGAIAFSLYMAICHPVKFRIYNQTSTVILFIAVSWGVNIIVASLVFTADDAFVHGDYMLFSFYRLKAHNIWYEVLKMIVMFLPSLLSIVCLIQIMIYKRGIRPEEAAAQSKTGRLVRQSIGVSSVYVVAFMMQIANENIFPFDRDTDPNNISFFILSIVYLYVVFKLPLFLVAFKPYRQVALRILCPCVSKVRVHPLTDENGDSQRTQLRNCDAQTDTDKAVTRKAGISRPATTCRHRLVDEDIREVTVIGNSDTEISDGTGEMEEIDSSAKGKMEEIARISSSGEEKMEEIARCNSGEGDMEEITRGSLGKGEMEGIVRSSSGKGKNEEIKRCSSGKCEMEEIARCSSGNGKMEEIVKSSSGKGEMEEIATSSSGKERMEEITSSSTAKGEMEEITRGISGKGEREEITRSSSGKGESEEITRCSSGKCEMEEIARCNSDKERMEEITRKSPGKEEIARFSSSKGKMEEIARCSSDKERMEGISPGKGERKEITKNSSGNGKNEEITRCSPGKEEMEEIARFSSGKEEMENNTKISFDKGRMEEIRRSSPANEEMEEIARCISGKGKMEVIARNCSSGKGVMEEATRSSSGHKIIGKFTSSANDTMK